MTADLPDHPAHWQQWPCGPECRYAQPMTGTFGEWLWCNHPTLGGHVVREGHDCRSYRATSSTDPVPPVVFKAS